MYMLKANFPQGVIKSESGQRRWFVKQKPLMCLQVVIF